MTLSPAHVSVVIPVFNGEHFVRSAIESALEEEPGEVIVVDDGSLDCSCDRVRSFPGVRLIEHGTNRGPAAARNTGWRAANHEFVAFLDADDWWVPGKLKKQLALFEQSPTASIVLGQLQTRHTPPHTRDDEALHHYSFGSALIRTSTFHTIGPMNENLTFGEDTDWFLRAREQNAGLLLHDDVVLLYRRHESNMTNARSNNARKQDLFAALRSSLNRRRQQGVSAPNLNDLDKVGLQRRR